MHIESEFPLPELAPWDHPGDEADVRIRLGEVPPFAGMENEMCPLTVLDPCHARICIPGVATFALREGSEFFVDPILPVNSVEFRNSLFGTGLGLLCHQRGIYPIHGSCLQLGDRAVIFSGASGAGKSTLAAALVQRGHRLIADDVCALSKHDGPWFVWPAFPRVKLLPIAHRAIFGGDPPSDTLCLQGKHHICFDSVHSFAAAPTPLDAIYFLEKAEEDEPEGIVDVTGFGCIALLQSQIFCRDMGMRLGRRDELFQVSAQVAAAVPIRRLRRPFKLDRINSAIELLEHAHKAMGSTVAGFL